MSQKISAKKTSDKNRTRGRRNPGSTLTVKKCPETGDVKLLYNPGSGTDLLGILTGIVENSSAIIFIKDLEGRYLLANKTFADLFGVSREEIIGKRDCDFLRDEVIDRIRKNANQVIRENRPLHFEEQIEINGRLRHFYSIRFPIKFSREYPKAIGGILTEVTERKRIENTLAESEAFYRIILLNMSDAVFLTDVQGRFEFVCPNVDNIFGHTANEVYKLGSISKLLPGLQLDEKELDRSGEVSNLEYSVQDKEKNRHYLLINVKKVSIKGGTRLYACRDITRRRRTEEELKSTQTTLVTEQVALRKKNIALKELINQIESEKGQIKRRINANIDSIVSPLLEILKQRVDDDLLDHLKLLENSLHEITAPFIRDLEKIEPRLSPRETEICNMIKNGLGSKDIARTLGVSAQTVIKQRKQIRKKLGINNSPVNLTSYLKTLK